MFVDTEDFVELLFTYLELDDIITISTASMEFKKINFRLVKQNLENTLKLMKIDKVDFNMYISNYKLKNSLILDFFQNYKDRIFGIRMYLPLYEYTLSKYLVKEEIGLYLFSLLFRENYNNYTNYKKNSELYCHNDRVYYHYNIYKNFFLLDHVTKLKLLYCSYKIIIKSNHNILINRRNIVERYLNYIDSELKSYGC